MRREKPLFHQTLAPAMELARRAAHRPDAGDIYGIPTPSPDAHTMIQELQRELLHEEIRQRIIVAELAKQQELEPEFRREFLYSDVDARFGQITMPHHGTSPLPHDEPLDVPASIERQPVKDRIEEWYRPPWCRPASENEPIVRAKRHKQALSGVKRKRSAETPSWICSVCDANCYNETDLQNHLRGRRHQRNIEALQGEGKGAEARLHEREVPQPPEKNLKPVSTWLCSICDANCTSQSDLENHLRGRRHQKKIEAFQGEGKGSEPRLHEKKMPQLAENNQKPVSRWMCSICSAKCKSQSDLSSHLRSRRHQENIEAFQGEGKGSEARLHEKKMPQLADNNQTPVSKWMCSICSANCKSQSDLSSHLRSRRHQQNVEAFQGEGKGSEARLHEKKMPQLADNNQTPVSRWMCSICSANCKSQSDLSSHLRSRRHQQNIEALQGDGKGTEASRWMCDICNAKCTSQSDFESHLRGRRHQSNLQA
ncbi:uncharacterized protein [Aegilops tauschii subsp. strangulata]|uniref:uncharacterized protein n=1 Tax=Aegilops tauschii subsp. strangulata TaxID=200361 RepID=UPI00098A6603